MQRQRGFTLLEIMVVIVILGILASLVVPNLMGNKEKADRQKVVSDLVALEGALDMYKLDNSRYPNSEQGLQALVSRPTAEPQARARHEPLLDHLGRPVEEDDAVAQRGPLA